MGNLSDALLQLREERKELQVQEEKLDQAISILVSLNGSTTARTANEPNRIISAVSRRKMARAQKARWVKARNSQPVAIANTWVSAPALAKRTM